jgi:hypothetical protein
VLLPSTTCAIGLHRAERRNQFGIVKLVEREINIALIGFGPCKQFKQARTQSTLQEIPNLVAFGGDRLFKRLGGLGIMANRA